MTRKVISFVEDRSKLRDSDEYKWREFIALVDCALLGDHWGQSENVAFILRFSKRRRRHPCTTNKGRFTDGPTACEAMKELPLVRSTFFAFLSHLGM